MKRTVCVIISARANYARLKSLLEAIKKHKQLKLQIITTCSANSEIFGNVSQVMENEGFVIDEKVFSHMCSETLETSVKITGKTLIKLASVLQKLKPDMVVINGDRYETIASAVAASYMNIPLIHLQGGDVTGNIDEKVRHAVTKLADVHFATSHTSYKRLLLLGENPDKVFMFGCPSIDQIKDLYGISKLDFNPIKKYKGFGTLTHMPKKYYVLMQHPTTTDVKNAKLNVEKTLNVIKKLKYPTFIFLPNPDASSKIINNSIKNFYDKNPQLKMHIFCNMEPRDFIKFIYFGECLIGNSSVGIIECSYLGIPVVNIGDRQKDRERGINVIDVPYDTEAIYEAIILWEKKGRPKQSFIYGDGYASQKIADTLATIELSSQKRLSYDV